MKFLLLLAFLAGCITTNDILPKETVVQAKPAEPKYKYKYGDCVKFNANKQKKTKMKVDGTPMFVLGVKRADSRINKPELYVVVLKHKRMDEPVTFTAYIKVFEEDTDKVACPK